MLSPRFIMPAIAIAALVFAAAPLTLAIRSMNGSGSGDPIDEGQTDEYTWVNGTVTAFLYDDETDHEDDTGHEGKDRVRAFVVDNLTVVELGPWWYWEHEQIDITDVVRVGDLVNVTGELGEEDGVQVIEAWHIDNITTGQELTIKEEGRPPWAGGPKGLGVDPWPPSEEDD